MIERRRVPPPCDASLPPPPALLLPLLCDVHVGGICGGNVRDTCEQMRNKLERLFTLFLSIWCWWVCAFLRAVARVACLALLRLPSLGKLVEISQGLESTKYWCCVFDPR